ncbi:DNA repair protein RecO [Candidatus Wolfebacteria bacterium]|nr:DNA repair protein RecO [Candidatus Wolfebacteria bacterium]
MKECLTDAFVLDAEDSGEFDRILYLYTRDLGKIIAKAKSSRKITSKLAGHLEPLSLSKVRLVEKNGTQITDAILLRQIENTPAAVKLFQFIKEMTYEFQTDKKLWLTIKKAVEGLKGEKGDYKPLLNILGFSPEFAECGLCKIKKPLFFSPKEQIFFCHSCAFKISPNELILVD